MSDASRVGKRMWRKIEVFPLSTYGLLKKDYALLYRKKKYLYLSVLLPVLIGLIYVLMLTQTSASMNVLVCDFDDAAVTDEVLASLDEFSIEFYEGDDCVAHMQQAVKDRKYLFGIVIEEGFSSDLEGLQPGRIDVYYDNSEPAVASLASWKIDTALEPIKVRMVMELGNEVKAKSLAGREKTRAVLEVLSGTQYTALGSLTNQVRAVDRDLQRGAEMDPGFLATPIVVEQQGVHPDYSLVDVGIAPLFVILCLFLILMLCSTGVIYDRKIKLVERIRASNTSMLAYMLSKIMFFFSLAVVQFVVVFVIFLLFGASYDIGLWMLFKAIVFITLVNALLGMIIGMISDSEGIAVLISLVLTLPLLFLSGMFYPLDLMPWVVQLGAKILPLQTEVMMIKEALLFGGNVSNWYILIPALLGLLVYAMLKRR